MFDGGGGGAAVLDDERMMRDVHANFGKELVAIEGDKKVAVFKVGRRRSIGRKEELM